MGSEMCIRDRDEMSHEDAVECIEFNTIGAYVGEKTPLFVNLDLDRVAKLKK